MSSREELDAANLEGRVLRAEAIALETRDALCEVRRDLKKLREALVCTDHHGSVRPRPEIQGGLHGAQRAGAVFAAVAFSALQAWQTWVAMGGGR